MSIHPLVTLRFAHRSDRGATRRMNEDTSAVEEVRLSDGRSFVLAAVADGMGGTRAGAEASQIAVTNAFDHFHDAIRHHLPQKDTQWQHLLVASLRAANAAVLARGTEPNHSSMGTTLMLAVGIGRRGHIVHIGDF